MNLKPDHVQNADIHTSGGGHLFVAALMLSGALHFGLAFYWAYAQPRATGAGAIETAAISVNLQVADILDSVESAQHGAASDAPAARPEPAGEGAAETEPAMEEERERFARELVRLKQIEDAHRAALEEMRKKREAEEQERVTREAAIREQRQRAAQEKRAASSASASGKRDERASAGRISATAGALRDYGAIVRARINRNKPAATRTGRVDVYLQIDASGGLSSARIRRSSGDRELDRRALAAVRSAAPFPTPPEGARSAQLRFNMPIIFSE